MFQITPLLADSLGPVIPNVVPLLAQNLASKNNEIQDIASQILDLFIEYLGNYYDKQSLFSISVYFFECFVSDGGALIQPFANIAQHGNARVKPILVNKLAGMC
jgi:hypothetical protein